LDNAFDLKAGQAMNIGMPLVDTDARPEAAEILKAVAVALFAERGVDGVTVRQIAEAAGQKNHAAVGYHFGSKEALVRAVVVHGAKLIDALRNQMLNELEARGGPTTLVEITRVLVRSSLVPSDPPWSECYNRFIVMLQLTNYRLFMDALEDRWNSGYLRCQNHIRRLLADIPSRQVNRRLVLMGGAMAGIIAAREREVADASRDHPMWKNERTIDGIASALASILQSD
jgi:AcrR family transcriptional regulator